MVPVEGHVQWPQRHRPILGGCRQRYLILGHGLYGYVVRPAGHQALEGSLSRSGRFALLLHVEDTVVGVGRLDGDLVVGIDAGRIRRLPQHQQGRLIPEPDDELPRSIGLYGGCRIPDCELGARMERLALD